MIRDLKLKTDKMIELNNPEEWNASKRFIILTNQCLRKQISKTEITNLWNERRYSTTDATDIINYKSYRVYYKELNAIKFNNYINCQIHWKFLSKLTSCIFENLYSNIFIKQIDIKQLLKNKTTLLVSSTTCKGLRNSFPYNSKKKGRENWISMTFLIIIEVLRPQGTWPTWNLERQTNTENQSYQPPGCRSQ